MGNKVNSPSLGALKNKEPAEAFVNTLVCNLSGCPEPLIAWLISVEIYFLLIYYYFYLSWSLIV